MKVREWHSVHLKKRLFLCVIKRERERERVIVIRPEKREQPIWCVCARGREGGEVLDRKKCISERGIHANDS